MATSATFSPQVILSRLTTDRLRPYLEDCDNDLHRALDLYAWNAQIAAAFLEDLGRLEVVLRNQFDEALTALVASHGLPQPWYDHRSLFPGSGGKHVHKAIARAKRQAAKHKHLHAHQGNVIAELGFGFWRFLCTERYLTSLWGPALASRFQHHPAPSNAVQIRADVESRMDRLHFLRNRVAHHEPIHRRALVDDAAMIFELTLWMCLDTHAWMTGLTRIPAVLASRPV